jgi:septal ring factor EnvC (AmiA/AmiB activator)
VAEAPSGGDADGGADTTAQQTRTAALTRPADIRAFPDSENSLRMPARGDVVASYGETVERRGTTTGDQGMMIATRPGARVVAPYDGKVVYAGPFKTYGRILIIQHGDRYHSLLAGLGRIDAIVGQWVLAGEPVGVMGDPSGQPPELYVELRRAGQPIDPAPWLARSGNKVRG